MKCNKDFLRDLIWEDSTETAVKISDEIVGKSRWSIEHRMVFQITDVGIGEEAEFYAVSYRTGATEQQDERPFEYDRDEIECERVYPVEVVVIEYRSAKK